MRPLEFPTPMSGLAIQPKRRGDEQRISEVLHKMMAEDPTLLVEHDVTLNETVLRGLGELHLRSALERMSLQYKIEVQTRPPRVPYRETIGAPAEGHARHKKQTGGAGQFGEVFLRVDRLRAVRDLSSSIMSQGRDSLSVHSRGAKGCRVGPTAGPVADIVQDLRVTVYDGKTSSVDSKEIAFVSAVAKRSRCTEQARPIVLEPIVNAEIEAPESHIGDITAICRHARPTHRHSWPGWRDDRRRSGATGELEGYSARLKSMTQGAARGDVAHHYEQHLRTSQQ